MRINKFITTSLFLLLVSIQTAIFAQENKSQDFLVIHNNDTLYGKVSYIDEQSTVRKFYKKIRVTTVDGKTKKIKRRDVYSFKKDGFLYEGFWLDQSATSVSLSNPVWTINAKLGDYYFLKLLTKGPLSHYELEWIEQGNTALLSMSLLKKESNSFFMRADQGVLGLKRNTLNRYFSDCSRIQEQIETKKLKSTSQIVDFYNKECI